MYAPSIEPMNRKYSTPKSSRTMYRLSAKSASEHAKARRRSELELGKTEPGLGKTQSIRRATFRAASRYTDDVNRRTFLAAGAAAAAVQAGPGPPRFIKSICSVMFPNGMTLPEKFRQAKNAGFEGIELRFGDEVLPSLSADEVKRLGDAAHTAGLQIASMWVSGAFRSNPINSPDPAVRARSLEG